MTPFSRFDNSLTGNIYDKYRKISDHCEVNMITSLKNKDFVTKKMFGKDKELKVFSTGDNKYDEAGNS